MDEVKEEEQMFFNKLEELTNILMNEDNYKNRTSEETIERIRKQMNLPRSQTESEVKVCDFDDLVRFFFTHIFTLFQEDGFQNLFSKHKFQQIPKKKRSLTTRIN